MFKSAENIAMVNSTEFKRPAITWLDYDYGLEREVFGDVGLVAAKVLPYSILIVTLDATEDGLKEPPVQEDHGVDLEKFDQMPLDDMLRAKCGLEETTKFDLRQDGIAEVYRSLLSGQINASVNSVLDPRSGEPDLVFVQLFNFRYSDGREMMTIGGMFVPTDSKELRGDAKFGFEDMPYFKQGREPYEISPPKLTLREARELNKCLPAGDFAAVIVPVKEEDKKLYSELYRYFPTFTEAEL